MSTTLPHTMSYSGDKPYIFISYAHKDSGIVVPLVQAMQNSGYRVWFDMGIEVGTEWSNDIAAHLRDCALFVAFISKNSVGSENCLDEIAYAKSHQKPALMIFLEEDVVLPEGTEMQTARFQRMYYNRIGTVEGYMASLNNSSFFAPCREVTATAAPVQQPVNVPSVAHAQPAVVPSAPSAPKKSKKGLWILLIAIVSVLAIVGGLIATGVIKFGGDEEKTEATNPLSGNITIDGKNYQLPVKLSAFLADGWKTQMAGDLEANKSLQLVLTKNGEEITVQCLNQTSETVVLSKASVCGITFECSDVSGFTLANGITAQSTKEEIASTYGTFEYEHKEDMYYSICGYGMDISQELGGSTANNAKSVMFVFDEQGKLGIVAIVHY